MEWSLAKTLANKHKTTSRRIFRRYISTAQTEYGPRACLKVEVQRDEGKRPLVAQFGGIPLKRKRQAILNSLSGTGLNATSLSNGSSRTNARCAAQRWMSKSTMSAPFAT